MRIHRFGSAALLVAGLALAAPACASAGAWYRYRQDDYGHRDYRELRQRAYDSGYHEGVERGRDDARHGRFFDVACSREYRGADEGYDRDWGSRDEYRSLFRQGFERGYNEAYRREGRGYRDDNDGRWWDRH